MKFHWQGFAVGFLALTMLDVVLSSPKAPGGLGGIAAGAGNLAEKILSPTVPAFKTSSPSLTSVAPSSSQPASPGTAQPLPIPQPPGQPPIDFTTPLPPGTFAA